jgi:hypothetical protein
MLDFYLVNINRREFAKIWAYDCSPVLNYLLGHGWSFQHVINIEYEGTGFSTRMLLEKGFTEKRIINP